jgi:hypothetical protein
MFKKGDILTLTFRNGYDAQGQPIWVTLERAEVLGCANGRLQVTYRDLDASHSDVEIDQIAFDISSQGEIIKQCEAIR